MIDWLFTNALAALVLAAVAGALIWLFRPAPAVRHALWLVVLFKLVAPGGPEVALPLPADRPAPVAVEPTQETVIEAELFTVFVEPRPGQAPEEAAYLALRADEPVEAVPEVGGNSLPAAPAAAPEPPGRPFDYRPWLVGLWVAGAVVVGYRQVRETVRFARFARGSRPAPDHLVAEVAIVANRLGVRVPAVRVLAGLASPVLWCLGRPVLLWPAGLECRLRGEGRRAVLAHELAHLRRRDHWVRRLEMPAAVLHWWNPLFWIARQKLRADAELACDAWAAGLADRRAYAEALLEVCSFKPRRRPAPAVGVLGEGRRAMQERLTMIMRDRIPCQLAFGAKLVVALMVIAAVPAWTLGQGSPRAEEEIIILQVAQAAEAEDAAAKEIEAQIKALAQKLAALKARQAEVDQKAAERAKEAQGKLAEKVKELRLRVQAPEGSAPRAQPTAARVMVAGEGGVKVIGPDGKEIQGAKVIIGGGPGAAPVIKTLPAGAAPRVELFTPTDGGARFVTVAPAGEAARRVTVVRAAGAGGAVTLSRATYKLNKDQAAALNTLLGSIKATVMETKVDGDAITVTTTPEAQATIGQIVGLIQGKPSTFRFEFKGVSPPPAPPAPPAVPSTPAKPAKPGAAGGPEKVNVNVIVEKALKEAGLGDKGIDPAKLRDVLKLVKPIEIEVEEVEKLKPGTDGKSKGEKK